MTFDNRHAIVLSLCAAAAVSVLARCNDINPVPPPLDAGSGAGCVDDAGNPCCVDDAGNPCCVDDAGNPCCVDDAGNPCCVDDAGNPCVASDADAGDSGAD